MRNHPALSQAGDTGAYWRVMPPSSEMVIIELSRPLEIIMAPACAGYPFPMRCDTPWKKCDRSSGDGSSHCDTHGEILCKIDCPGYAGIHRVADRVDRGAAAGRKERDQYLKGNRQRMPAALCPEETNFHHSPVIEVSSLTRRSGT